MLQEVLHLLAALTLHQELLLLKLSLMELPLQRPLQLGAQLLEVRLWRKLLQELQLPATPHLAPPPQRSTLLDLPLLELPPRRGKLQLHNGAATAVQLQT